MSAYLLKEREKNSIINAIDRSMYRMIAAQKLMEAFDEDDPFMITADSLLDSGKVIEWITENYSLLAATFYAVKVLVDDTRDNLEMLSVHSLFDQQETKSNESGNV